MSGDALDKAFEEAPAAEAAETASAPAAAEATTTSETTEATSAASTTAPVTPPPTPNPLEEYTRTLTTQARETSAQVQRLVEQNQAVMDRVLQQQQPSLSKEQRDAIIAQQFEELNQDPDAYVGKRVKTILDEKLKEIEAKYVPRTPEYDRQVQTAQHISALYRNEQGKVLRPELQDPAFMDVLRSKEVTDAVYDRYYAGQSAETVMNDRGFYLECYHEAKNRQAAEFAKTKQQSEQDLDAQRNVIRTQGQPPAGKPAGSGGSAKVSPEQAFKADMVGSVSPMEALMRGAEFKDPRAQPRR